MSFSLRLRRNGATEPDYQISSGKLVLSYNADAVRDRIFTSLSTQLGEWFLDNEDGVPYYPIEGESSANFILGGKMTEGEVAAVIRRRILTDVDVKSILSLSVTQNSQRRVSINASVKVSLPDGTNDIIEVNI